MQDSVYGLTEIALYFKIVSEIEVLKSPLSRVVSRLRPVRSRTGIFFPICDMSLQLRV